MGSAAAALVGAWLAFQLPIDVQMFYSNLEAVPWRETSMMTTTITALVAGVTTTCAAQFETTHFGISLPPMLLASHQH